MPAEYPPQHTIWRDGSGAPSNSLGNNGDYYLDDLTGNVYTKTLGAYSIVAVIKGNPGAPGGASHTYKTYANFPNLASALWATPNAAEWNIAGRMGCQALIEPSAWPTAGSELMVASKWLAAGSHNSWQFSVHHKSSTSTPALLARVQIDASTVATFTSDTFICPTSGPVFVYWDVVPDTGAGKSSCTFYYSDDDRATWHQIGATITSSTHGTIHADTAVVQIGASQTTLLPFNGRIYHVDILNGTTIVGTFDATNLSSVAAFTNTDSPAHTWTPGASAQIASDPKISGQDVKAGSIPYDVLYNLPSGSGLSVKLYGGAKCNRRHCGATVPSGSNVVTGLGATAADIGKLFKLQGAGSTKSGATGVAVTSATPSLANILHDAGATFDLDDVGKWCVITGAGAGGTVPWVGRVWGLIDSHTVRLTSSIITSVATNAQWTVSGDLYGVITNVDANGDVHISTNAGGGTPANAGVTVTDITRGGKTNCVYGTDDTAAIQATHDALPSDTNTQSGGTLIIDAPCVTSASIVSNLPGLVVAGIGGQGSDRDLGRGSSSIMCLTPGVTPLIYGPISAVGCHGAMTAGLGAPSAVLTDPHAAFTSGLAGKTIWVMGAGTQTGSSKMIRLATTVLSVDSPTQLTLAAQAQTTVANAEYAVVTTGQQLQNPPKFRDFYIQGHVDTPIGFAYMAKHTRLTDLTVSDCYNGVNIMGFGGAGAVNDYAKLTRVISCAGRIQVCLISPATTSLVGCYLDGNLNNPVYQPGEKSYGLKTTGHVTIDAGTVICDADVLVYADGQSKSSPLHLFGHYEGFGSAAIEISSDGTSQGHILIPDTVSGGGFGGFAIKLNAGVQRVKLGSGWEGGLLGDPYSIHSTAYEILVERPGTFTIDGQLLKGGAYKELSGGTWVSAY